MDLSIKIILLHFLYQKLDCHTEWITPAEIKVKYQIIVELGCVMSV